MFAGHKKKEKKTDRSIELLLKLRNIFPSLFLYRYFFAMMFFIFISCWLGCAGQWGRRWAVYLSQSL